AQKRENGKTLVVIVTSDKGLAGSVNSSVLKKAEELFKVSGAIDTICIGRKAVEFANREKKTILSSYTNVSDDVALSDVYTMASLVVDRFATGAYTSVSVLYQNFVSTFEQEPT